MKKNLVKAMSVGLSAITLAGSVNVPVLAEEISNNDDANSATETGSQAENKTESNTLNSDAVNAIADTIEAVSYEENDGFDDINKSLEEANKALLNIDSDVKNLEDKNIAASESIDSYNQTVNESNQGVVEGDVVASEAASEIAQNAADAGSNATVAEAEKQAEIAEAALATAEAVKEQAESKVEAATLAYENAQKALSNAENELNDILNRYGISDSENINYSGDLKAATDAAKKALDKAVNTYDLAEKALNNAKNELDIANKNLDTKKEAAKNAENILNDAQTNANSLEDASQSARKALDNATTAVSTAENNAAKAATAATAAQTEADNANKKAQKQISDKKAAEQTKAQAEIDLKAAKEAKAEIEANLKSLEIAYNNELKAHGPSSKEAYELKQEMIKLNAEIEKQQKIIDDSTKAIEIANGDKTLAQAELTNASSVKATADQNLNTATQELSAAINNESNQLTASQQAKATLIKLEKSVKSAELEKDNAQKAFNQATIELKKAQEEYAAAEYLEDIIKTVNDRRNHSRSLDNNSEIAKSLIKFHVYENNKKLDPSNIIFEEHMGNIHWEDNSIIAYYIDAKGNKNTLGIYNFDTRNSSNEHVYFWYERLTDHIVILEKETESGYSFLGWNYYAPKSKVILDERDFVNGETSYHEATKNARAKHDEAVITKNNKDNELTVKKKTLYYYRKACANAVTQAQTAEANYESAKTATSAARAKVSDLTTVQTNANNAVVAAQGKVTSANDTINEYTGKQNAAKADKKSAEEKLANANKAKEAAEAAVAKAQKEYYDQVKLHGEASAEANEINKNIKALQKTVADQKSIIDNLTVAISLSEKDIKVAEAELLKANNAKIAAEAELTASKTALEEAKVNKEAAEAKLAEAKSALTKAKEDKKAADEAVEAAINVVNTRKSSVDSLTVAMNAAAEKLDSVKRVYSKILDVANAIMNLKTNESIKKSGLDAMQENLKKVTSRYEATKAARNVANDNVNAAKMAEEASKQKSNSSSEDNSVYYSTDSSKIAEQDIPVIIEGTDEIVSMETLALPNAAKAVKANKTSTKVEKTTVGNAVEEEVKDTLTIEDEAAPLAGNQKAVTTKDSGVVDGSQNHSSRNGLQKLLFSTNAWWGWLLILVAVLGGGFAYFKKKSTSEESNK